MSNFGLLHIVFPLVSASSMEVVCASCTGLHFENPLKYWLFGGQRRIAMLRQLKTTALVICLTMSALSPLLAETKIEGVDEQRDLTILVITGRDKYGSPEGARVRGVYIGQYPGLKDLRYNEKAPGAGLVPVSISVRKWDEEKEEWEDIIVLGWAWEKKIPKKKPKEVRFMPCCAGRSPDRIPQMQLTQIINFNLNIMISQSTAVARPTGCPEYCSCSDGRGGYRPLQYRRHYSGYTFAHSACGRVFRVR